ncbi:MAG: hypothetical protein ACI8T1_001857, partial [Verrucomicrobiales bacterium]
RAGKSERRMEPCLLELQSETATPTEEGLLKRRRGPIAASQA